MSICPSTIDAGALLLGRGLMLNHSNGTLRGISMNDPSLTWMEQQRMIPCETCGKPTSFVFTGRCRNCLTVETLLHEYLRSEAGREFVESALERARNGG